MLIERELETGCRENWINVVADDFGLRVGAEVGIERERWNKVTPSASRKFELSVKPIFIWLFFPLF